MSGAGTRKCDMGMSIGVTYSTRLGEYRIFGEENVDDLIAQLRQADLVVGYNHINFDYQVLMGYTCLDLPSQLVSLDLCKDLEERIQHRPKLDHIAAASLGCGKTAEGLQAIRWWREGKIMEIARYCCFDVKVTKLVHEYGATHGKIKFIDNAGHEKGRRRRLALLELMPQATLFPLTILHPHENANSSPPPRPPRSAPSPLPMGPRCRQLRARLGIDPPPRRRRERHPNIFSNSINQRSTPAPVEAAGFTFPKSATTRKPPPSWSSRMAMPMSVKTDR